MNKGSDIRGVEAIISDMSTKIALIKNLVNETLIIVDFDTPESQRTRIPEKLKEMSKILSELDDRRL